jgi:hypothetical protein
VYPTQAKKRLEWGTHHLLPVHSKFEVATTRLSQHNGNQVGLVGPRSPEYSNPDRFAITGFGNFRAVLSEIPAL